MLAQDRKTPTPVKRVRRAPVEATEPTVIVSDPPRQRKRKAPTDTAKPTAIIPAASQLPATLPAKRETPTGRRESVTARPISSNDSRIVNQATWMLAAMDVLDESPAAPARIADVAPPAPVTIVGGNSTSKMVAMRVAPPPRKKRHWASGVVILTLIAAVSVTAIATATPLGSGHATGLAVHAAGPLGLPVALDSVNKAPSGQWVAVIGMQPNQDVGGGAGPGVKAPGSAGLPVSSVVVNVNTGAPTAAESNAFSPAPLSPWPPAWAFDAVPGYSAYGMSDVGGYYNWSFGQCTWWAQYERKDENLMHMGNAQFWANGARSRGYSVGWQPRVGATVVFQPGVQGAGGAGHVAHVVKVYPAGWFLVSEMNFYWNGGGWGRVDYRFAHEGSGVEFIY